MSAPFGPSLMCSITSATVINFICKHKNGLSLQMACDWFGRFRSALLCRWKHCRTFARWPDPNWRRSPSVPALYRIHWFCDSMWFFPIPADQSPTVRTMDFSLSNCFEATASLCVRAFVSMSIVCLFDAISNASIRRCHLNVIGIFMAMGYETLQSVHRCIGIAACDSQSIGNFHNRLSTHFSHEPRALHPSQTKYSWIYLSILCTSARHWTHSLFHSQIHFCIFRRRRRLPKSSRQFQIRKKFLFDSRHWRQSNTIHSRARVSVCVCFMCARVFGTCP